MQAIKLKTAPSAEPISLAEAKLYLKVDDSNDDTLITALISAARRWVEEHTRRRLITQTWELWLDCFPRTNLKTEWFDGVRDGLVSDYKGTDQRWIDLPFSPLQSVGYLKTYDNSDNPYTMSASDYVVDGRGEHGRLSLRMNSVWPQTVLRPINGIEIEVVVGYGATGAAVPGPILEAIKQLIASWYQCRGEDKKIPGVVYALLEDFRVLRI